MSTFTNFAIRHEYASLAALGDWLGEVSSLIDWDASRRLLADLYTNAEGRGGRPNYDVVLMIRLLEDADQREYDGTSVVLSIAMP